MFYLLGSLDFLYVMKEYSSPGTDLEPVQSIVLAEQLDSGFRLRLTWDQ
jgi:hypothetical protein